MKNRGEPQPSLLVCRRSELTNVRSRTEHHKPPYSSPDPFRYRTLTYVQLSDQSQSSSLPVIWKSRLQVAQCPRSRPKRLSTSATIPTVGITYVPRRQTTPMTVMKSTASPWEAAHESQTLRAVSLYAARLGSPLRSRSRTSRVREVRRRARDAHQPLSTRGPQEATMRNSPQYLRDDAAQRCAICDGKFGLIRHYSWRTALCSKKCADRFKARQEGDRRWLRRLRAA